MEKSIITVVGKDKCGIIAKVSGYLYSKSVNILDISQTITGGFFNMMMIVDTSSLNSNYTEFSKNLENLGKEIGVEIKTQKEEIFLKTERL